jgi:hypothetical protein
MLTKFKLVNVPQGGVRHSVGSLGLVNIDETLTDSLAEKLIQAGLKHYFEPADKKPAPSTPQSHDESENTTSRKGSRIGDRSGVETKSPAEAGRPAEKPGSIG